jgi:hypothetical protein
MGDSAEISEMKGFDSYPVQLGDLMRGERATMGKSLLDVQRDLRIKAAYIAAIERCDHSAFQTPGFIAGYVRSYARYLGLDPEATFTQFSVEANFDGVHPGISRKPKPASVTVMKPKALKSGTPDPLSRARTTFVAANDGLLAQFSPSALGSIFVLMILILGIGYGAWAVLQDIQRVEFGPADTVAEPVAGVPVVSVEAQSAALDQLYRPKELDVPVMTPRDGPIAALDPDNIGALVENNGGLRAQETAALMADNTPRVTEIADPRVEVVASRPAWVRISRLDGTILFEKILDGGESFRLPAGSVSTVLRAGNSGAVYLTLDGKPYGPVGGGTSVAKGIALGPAEIMNNFAAVRDTDALEALDSPRVITLNNTE